MRKAVMMFVVLFGLATMPALAQAPSLSPETSLRIANEELNRGDLTPRKKAQNLLFRARAYWLLGRTDEAFADLDQAEPLDAMLLPHVRVQRALILSRTLNQVQNALAALESLPAEQQIPAVLIMRGELLMGSGRHTEAASILEPVYRGGSHDAPRARRLIAQAHFNMGNFKKAVTLYDEMLPGAFERHDRQYPALWRFAAERLMGLEAVTRLRNDTRPSDRLTWPGPIIKFALGEITAGELMRAAQTDPQGSSMGSTCEAPFYIGVVEEKAGRSKEANYQYLQVLRNCHSGMFELWAAEARLKVLR
jgi:lipoprotein NlpI